ncbi:nucleotidyltransferase family protein [Candidatus Uhrbacteria bacterium]|nr:nucleotidyltransferase family protein [Candidatus Uhrbacteria bacterium]
MTLQSVRKKVIPVLKKAAVTRAAFFGSYARNTAKKNSDIDIVVSFKGKKSLFDMVRLKAELEKKLKKKVDIVTYNAIHPLLKERIMEEQKIIYEERS